MSKSVSRIRQHIAKNPGISGFFVVKPENINYFTGFTGSFGYALITQEKVYLITDSRYSEKAQKISDERSGQEFLLFDEDFEKNHGQKFSGKFFLEGSCTLSQKQKIQKLFPNLSFEVNTDLLEEIRREKTSEEVQKITTAQNQVDKVLISLLQEKLRENITEKALAWHLELAIREGGNFGLSFDPIVAFGENSALPHHHPTDRKLQKGNNILIDCGAKFEGYCSDMTRNFAFGSIEEINKKFLQKFKIIRAAQEATLDKIIPDASGNAIDTFCRAMLGEDEKFFGHGLGHGVGLEIHELPVLSKRKDYTLKQNDIVTCEPGIYYPGEFGIRIEDLLIVQENFPQVLTQTTKNLLIFDETGNFTEVEK